jgi:hypothetical protein
MRTLTAAIAGNPPEVHVFPWKTAMNGPVVGSMANGRVSDAGERVRTALIDAGWRITMFTETTGATVVATTDPAVRVPTRFVYFTATKGGLSLKGFNSTVLGGTAYGRDEETVQRLDIWAVDTAAVRPLTIAGLLLGALAGWLITAALAYRTRHSGQAHRTTVAILGVTAFAAAVVPAYDLYRNLYQVLSYDNGAPNPYIVYSPSELPPAVLVLVCTGIGFLALAAAVLIAVRGARIGPDPAGQDPAASN